MMRICANPNCAILFTPKKRTQRYCCRPCAVKPGWNFYGGIAYDKGFATKQCSVLRFEK